MSETLVERLWKPVSWVAAHHGDGQFAKTTDRAPYEAADEITRLQSRIEELEATVRRVQSAAKTIMHAEGEELKLLREKAREAHLAVKSLDSEREANARLTDELERTQRNRDMWKEQCDQQAEQLAALNTRPSDGWQGMESAPKDGTEFLSCGGPDNLAGKVQPTRWLSPGPYTTENGKNTEGMRRYQWPDGFYWAGYDGFVGPVSPSRWQPLPPPPKEPV